MAAFTYVDAFVSINSVDHSTDVKTVQLTVDLATEDATTMGSDWTVLVGGVLSGSVSLEFVDDMDNGAVDDLIWALTIARTAVALEIRPDSAAVGTNNPKFTGNILPTGTSVGGAHGSLAMKSVTWPVTGTLTRAEA